MDGEASTRSYQTDMCPVPVCFDLCLGFVWHLSDKWRSQVDRIHLSGRWCRWCHCCRLQGLRVWWVCVCMRLCKAIFVYQLTIDSELFSFFLLRRLHKKVNFKVYACFRIVCSKCNCVCEHACVCMCGYLLSSEPTGAKQGSMTLMRCVGMCPRVVLVWLSFCCFRTAPPSSYPALFK